MGTAQASAVADAGGRAAAASRWRMHTPTEVKAAVTGNGRADKAQVTAMVTRILGLDVAPEARRRRRRPRPRHLPRLARWRPGPSAASGRCPEREGGRPMIASVSGTGPRGRRSTRPSLEVGGVGLLVHTTPGTAAGLRRGAPGRALATTHGRARGVAHALRLRRRRRAGRLRAGADRLRRRAPARAGHARGARARRAARGRQHRRPRRADQGARHRQEGRRAHRARAARQDRPALRRAGGGRRRHGRRPRRGASRSARRSSASAGRSSRPTTRSTGSPPRPATAVDVSGLLRAALRELGR